jgi:hypothetical protein
LSVSDNAFRRGPLRFNYFVVYCWPRRANDRKKRHVHAAPCDQLMGVGVHRDVKLALTVGREHTGGTCEEAHMVVAQEHDT